MSNDVNSQKVSELCLAALDYMATSPKGLRERLTDAWAIYLKAIRIPEVPPKLRVVFERVAATFHGFGPGKLDDSMIEARAKDVVDLYRGTKGLYEV